MSNPPASHPVQPGPKHCPRCGAPFHCTADAPSQCQCAGIDLPADLLDALSRTYPDCLCATCLLELAGQGNRHTPALAARAGPESIAESPERPGHRRVFRPLPTRD